MRSHHTQTNEVGRCAALLPAMPAGPLALVEVGASAGLCLMLDRFHYDYGTIEIGDETSPVRLHCALRGDVEPPLALPQIAWRSGLDIEPVDLNDPERARWLMACIWPDHVGRRTRLEAAIRLWKQDAPPVRRGDLIDDFPTLLAEVPLDATLVVFHSAVLPYVSPERRQAFVASASRPLKATRHCLGFKRGTWRTSAHRRARTALETRSVHGCAHNPERWESGGQARGYRARSRFRPSVAR